MQQWQSDRKQLKQQIQQLKSQAEQVQSRLDETSWTLCQKSGEMALLKSQLKEAQNEQSQRCQEMAKMRTQLKESQELAHNTRQRLEQAMTHQKPLDNRRSITSPILSGRKLIGDSDPNGTTDIQRLQRRLLEQQQSIDAERQVILSTRWVSILPNSICVDNLLSCRCGTKRRPPSWSINATFNNNTFKQ